jgi:hypothetical protein
MSDAAHADGVLARAWEEGTLGRAITHEEHLRIAFALLRRHGRDRGRERILEGTRRNTQALGASERFDAELTGHWTDAIAEAIETSGARTFEELIQRRPELSQSDLFGAPKWHAGQPN